MRPTPERGTARPPLQARVEILGRLEPDIIHPARLAGPHAWHPWGMTTTPPDDRKIRLWLPIRPDDHGQATHVLAGIADQLRRPPWPPRPPLALQLSGTTLAIRSDDQPYAEMRCTAAPCSNEGAVRLGPEVVTRTGWPILNELEALRDRINVIDPLEPTVDDLHDLAHWTTSRADREPTRARAVISLQQLVRRLSLYDSAAHNRLQRILTLGRTRAEIAPEASQVLAYLQAELTAAPLLRLAPILAAPTHLHRQR